MKIKKTVKTKEEVEILDGYHKGSGGVYFVNGESATKVFILNDYASIQTAVNEYDNLDEAEPITKDEFEAELEKAFEIIREKL